MATLSALVLLLAAMAAIVPGRTAAASSTPVEDWQALTERAKGQTVYWNAWGGDTVINAYIDWVAARVKEQFDVTVEHVKLTDTGSAVARVVAEKAAGRSAGGSIDLIWINGENFAAMKRNGLLYGPFAEMLPNFRYVDVAEKPSTILDFTVPTDGFESPWGMAHFIFMYDRDVLASPPKSAVRLLDWARTHPGRFTYPQPPDFVGTSFLKQALLELATDRDRLLRPVGDDFEATTAPLWAYLDELRPHLWRGGKNYPESSTRLRRMLDDREVDIAMAFNPATASNDIANGLLPKSTRTFIFDAGTLSNSHFVAIPFNASAREGAMVVANFLISPEAQLHKQDPAVWGDFTVLDVAALPVEERARFRHLKLGPATLTPEELTPSLPEPHPSWVGALEAEWQRRYGH
ncbi:ABC transporter substrate-binding protein [Oceanibacterium hippocampi]|nr:ABC transporter substrate-binding protein [Oceanibacterium hippocampi]